MLDACDRDSVILSGDVLPGCRRRKETVTLFCSISMPVDFYRHLVGKNSEKCLSL